MPLLDKMKGPGSEAREDGCPLCSAPHPRVILAGTSRCLKKCGGCGVAYLHPRPSEPEVHEFFAKDYIRTEEDVDVRFGTRMVKSHREVARFIQGRKTRGRILDLGCAGGHFLDRFFPTSVWEKWGIDLSQLAGGKARAKSIRMHTGDIHSAALPAAAFDVVTVLDTFYYFAEPWRELEEIRRVLKPDGLLVIVLPCAGSHIWRNTGWRPKLLSSSRTSLLERPFLFFYDPGSIATILRGSCFQVVAVRPLHAIDQGTGWHNWIANAYYAMSVAGWSLSSSRCMVAPRFMVAANRDS